MTVGHDGKLVLSTRVGHRVKKVEPDNFETLVKMYLLVLHTYFNKLPDT